MPVLASMEYRVFYQRLVNKSFHVLFHLLRATPAHAKYSVFILY